MNKESIEVLGKKLEFLFNNNQRDFGYVEAVLDIKYKTNLMPNKTTKYSEVEILNSNKI